MKVLHVIPTMSTRYGGPAFFVKDIARFQALSGLKVSVFTTNTDYPRGILNVPLDAPEIVDGANFYYFAVQIRPMLVSLKMAYKLIRTLKNYDIVHIHGLYRFPSTFAAFLSRKYKIPYIIKPHGSLNPFLYKQSAYNLFAKRAYEKLFELPNLNHATAIHFTSDKEKENTSFLNLRSPGFVASNGIDWTKYTKLPPRGKIRKRLGLNDEPIILFLGRINFKKGLDILIKAFAHIVRLFPQAVLVIAGPDNEGFGAKVKRIIEELGLAPKIFWLGMLYDNEVREAYVDADIFVLSSYTENFGLAVVEAMACGLPVVISDQVNIYDDIRRSMAGKVVALDSQLVAQAVAAILKDRKAAAQMGGSGRCFVKNSYDYRIVVEKLTKIYTQVINRQLQI